jgi:hypothetical protein
VKSAFLRHDPTKYLPQLPLIATKLFLTSIVSGVAVADMASLAEQALFRYVFLHLFFLWEVEKNV